MKNRMKTICCMLAVALVIMVVAPVAASAAETGNVVVASSDFSYMVQNKTLVDAARITFNTNKYWVELFSDVTTDGALFRGTNLTLNLNSYTVTGNITFTNGIKLLHNEPAKRAAVYGTIYVTGGVVTVAEGIYVQDWELSGGSVNFEPKAEDLAEGYEAVDNGDGTWSIQEKSESAAIEIRVDNLGEGSGAVVTAPTEGWVEGTNTFTVTGSSPCVAAVSHDGGATYTRLTAIVAESDNIYRFTVENVTAATIIGIVPAGDANGDGSFTNADVTMIRAVYAGKKTVDALHELACDVNGDGVFTNADVTMMRAAYAGKTTIKW